MTVLAAALLCVSCSGDDAREESEPAVRDDSAERALLLDEIWTGLASTPPREELRVALDAALRATDNPVNAETYGRARNVLVPEDEGLDTMAVLRCMPSTVGEELVPGYGGRRVETFPSVLAACRFRVEEGLWPAR